MSDKIVGIYSLTTHKYFRIKSNYLSTHQKDLMLTFNLFYSVLFLFNYHNFLVDPKFVNKREMKWFSINKK